MLGFDMKVNISKYYCFVTCHIKILCRNVPVAEVAEIDGHRQAQPLRGYIFIVLTLCKIIFSLTLVFISLTQAN